MFAASKTDSASTGGYQISRSLRFNSADSSRLERTWSANGSRTIATASFWVKRGSLGAEGRLIAFDLTGSGTIFWLFFNTSDQLQVYVSGTAVGLTSTQVFRDPSAWYHIVVAIDTTQTTTSDRIKLYVNNAQITSFTGTQTYYSQNATVQFNNTAYTGLIGFNNSATLSGYMTEFNWIDGQALTPSSFGETNAQTGVWQPKAYSGSYGTNGFYLNFSDNSNTTAATLGKDYSGNGNNWTPNNFSVTAGAGNDSLVDSPTSYGTDTGVGGTVRGNYATMNPLNKGSTVTLSNGNLDQVTFDANWDSARASIAVASGKWYWEVTITGTSQLVMHGVDDNTYNVTTNPSSLYVGAYTNSWGVYANTGQKRNNTGTGTAYGSAFAQNDVMIVAVDMDSGKIWWGKNGTWFASGDPVAGTNAAYTNLSGYTLNPATSGFNVGSDCAHNFGQRPFAYTAPSGFKALCTQNLPTPTIGATTATQAGKYFNPVLYTGTGASLSVTGVGFQPDWVWVKGRSGATDHGLYDAVRGVQKQLESNTTGAETTETTGITAFGSDGFTTGALAQLNTSSATYVAWNWKANGSGSTNTSGSITSTVSANTTSGFSVVTYTGTGANATVGHGLGVAPSMVIVKSRTLAGGHWTVYHIALGNTKGLLMNTSDSAYTNSGFWNNTTPTSTVFTVGTDGSVNQSSQNQVAYCFAEIAGYSKFGSYTGNGSTDGPFVYCGFRPAFVLFKRTDATSDWWMYDTKRSPSNVIDIILWPNYADAEGTGASIAIDILSNGFKPRSNNATFNGSGGTYIFMAFASNPFKYSLAR